MAHRTDFRDQGPLDRAAPHPGTSVTAGVISLGFVVEEVDPLRAGALCDAMTTAVPASVKVELLVPDDHSNPRRRELVEVVDRYGDAVHLVPSSGDARCAMLDALSQASGSGFIVVPLGDDVPWHSIGAVVDELLADGADAVAVGGVSIDAESGVEEPDHRSGLAECLGLAGVERSGRVGASGASLVVIRRWVARWLFNDIPQDSDVAEELDDRARLLDLRLLLLDEHAGP